MTLAEMMRQERFPVPLTLSILRRCARQLDAAHESGLIHGGLTPSQILIAGPADEQTIQVEVKEYGGPRQQQENLVIGLAVPDFAPYMSPEEILGTPIDRRSDEFYLAVIAYELFCGRKPFQSGSISDLFFEICTSAPPPPEQLNPDLSSDAAIVLLRALSKDPTQRYRSCSEFVGELERSLAVPAPGPFVPPTFPERPLSTPVTPVFDLPAAIARVYSDEPKELRRSQKPGSSVKTFGIFALAAIAVIALGARLLNWHSKPTLPVQVLDPQTGPTTPPAVQSASPAKPKPIHEQASPTKRAVHTSAAPTSQKPRQEPSIASNPNQSPGSADVDLLTQPPGARMIVDNRPDMTCNSPCTLVLPPGRHVLSAGLPGFADSRRIFHVPEDASILISMNKSLGTVVVTSNPPGATLLVDGQNAGHTPTSLRLAPGQHRIDALLGSQAQQRVVEIQADAIHATSFDLRSR